MKSCYLTPRKVDPIWIWCDKDEMRSKVTTLVIVVPSKTGPWERLIWIQSYTSAIFQEVVLKNWTHKLVAKEFYNWAKLTLFFERMNLTSVWIDLYHFYFRLYVKLLHDPRTWKIWFSRKVKRERGNNLHWAIWQFANNPIVILKIIETTVNSFN